MRSFLDCSARDIKGVLTVAPLQTLEWLERATFVQIEQLGAQKLCMVVYGGTFPNITHIVAIIDSMVRQKVASDQSP